MQTNNQSVIHLTSAGLKKLVEEYEELVKVKRPQILARLDQARSLGDLSENAAYQQIRRGQAFLEGRIGDLEAILKKARVVKKKSDGKVELGSRVKLKTNGQEESYLIISETEADSASGKISVVSPLGRELLGKKAGETIEIEAPVGRVVYTVLEVE